MPSELQKYSGWYYFATDTHDIEHGLIERDRQGRPIFDTAGMVHYVTPGMLSRLEGTVAGLIKDGVSIETLDACYRQRCSLADSLAKSFIPLTLMGEPGDPSFFATTGDGGEGLSRSVENIVAALKEGTVSATQMVVAGAGVTRISEHDFLSDLRHRVAFSQHVTKFFKGINSDLQRAHVFGSRLTIDQADTALASVEARPEYDWDADGVAGFRRRRHAVRFAREWSDHMPAVALAAFMRACRRYPSPV
jgi:hypothetical protein